MNRIVVGGAMAVVVGAVVSVAAGVVGAAVLTTGCATTPSATTTASTEDWPASLKDSVVTAAMGSPHAGDIAPAFELPSANGAGVVRSSELRGKPLFLHFTATWCPYCREEIATVAQLAKESAGRGNVVLVDVKEDRAHWQKFGGVSEPALIVAHDDDGAVATRYSPPKARPILEPYEVPIQGTLLIDKDGVIRIYVLADNSNYDPNMPELRAMWTAMLGEAPPATTTTTPALAAATASLTSTASTTSTTPPSAIERPRVTVSAQRPAVDASGHGWLDLALDVPAGFHIMSNAPLDPALIPTFIAVTSSDIDGAVVTWPVPQKAMVGTQELLVFEGHVVAHVTFTSKSAHPKIDGTLRYQMCDAGRCYMPTGVEFVAGP